MAYEQELVLAAKRLRTASERLTAEQKRWVEAQHPRDRVGRFAEKPGGRVGSRIREGIRLGESVEIGNRIEGEDLMGNRVRGQVVGTTPMGGRGSVDVFEVMDEEGGVSLVAPAKVTKVEKGKPESIDLDSLAEIENIGDRKDRYAELPMEDRDKLSNAAKTIPEYVEAVVGPESEWPDTGTVGDDIEARLDRFDSMMNPKQRALVAEAVHDLDDALVESGADPEDRRTLTLRALDWTVAQEQEANGRTLGDHGIRHLKGDIDLSLAILEAEPSDETVKDRALIHLAGLFHDSGYVAPAARMFLDADHPRHSKQAYDANVKDLVTRIFGKQSADHLGRIIETHADTDMDWADDRFAASFRLADNLALFHAEKLPGLMYHVRKNTDPMIRFAKGDIDLAETRRRLRENVEAEADLPDGLRGQLLKAADEFTTMTPKFTIGLLGGKIDKVTWHEDHPAVTIKRSRANEAITKVLDLGQRQFIKLAETYGIDTDELKREHGFTFRHGDRIDLEVAIEGAAIKAAVDALRAALVGFEG